MSVTSHFLCNTVMYGIVRCFHKALWDKFGIYIRTSDLEIYRAIGLLDNRDYRRKRVFQIRPSYLERLVYRKTVSSCWKTTRLLEYLKPLIEQSSETLSGTELTNLTQLLYKFQDIFKSPDGQLGPINLIKHRIDTGNALPIKQ